MSRAFNDGFNDEGVFVGHEEVEENDLREELNTFVRAGQKLIKAGDALIKAGDAMAAKLGDTDESKEWKRLRAMMKLPGEVPSSAT